MQGKKVRIFLEVVKGAKPGRRFELGAGENLIGRWDQSSGSFPEINLEEEDLDAKASRKHAVIIVDGPRLAVQDLSSLNGTVVNGKHCGTEEVLLKLGDHLLIGKVLLRLISE